MSTAVVEILAAHSASEYDKTQTKFLEFHRRNPHIYDLFVTYAKQVKDAGHAKYSVWAVANRIRWHYAFERDPNEQFKISNDYLSRYARLIMQQEPELRGFFNLKKLKADRLVA